MIVFSDQRRFSPGYGVHLADLMGSHPNEDEARVGRASLYLILGHRGWLTGGVGGTAPMPLRGEPARVDLVPVAGQSGFSYLRSGCRAISFSYQPRQRNHILVVEFVAQVVCIILV